MPILAVNQFGQIYQTDPDREDGLGFGYAPECVEQGDLTLGSAYLKSQNVRQNDLIKLRRDQQQLDREDEYMRAQERAKRNEAYRRDTAQLRMLENPQMKMAVLRKAHSMGCECEYSTPISGNVMTANGQAGYKGLNRDQRVLQDVAAGNTHTAYKADPEEVRQHQERIAAQRLLRLKARR